MSRPVAVVTGAGSGIGRAVTLALLDFGYSVALAGRRAEPLEETIADSEAVPDATLAVAADVADPAAVDALFDAVLERFGRVDLLFNNAGSFGRPAPFEDYAREEWRAVVDVNLNGAFLCAQRAYRAMLEQDPRGGRIINNGSISAHTPRPHAVAYTATKHAITGLTKQLALEGRAHGHRVRADRRRQRRDRDDGRHRARRAAGRRHDGGRGDDGRGQRRPRRPLHGRPAARRERALHDRHGDRDAVRRARLSPGFTRASATPPRAAPPAPARPRPAAR